MFWEGIKISISDQITNYTDTIKMIKNKMYNYRRCNNYLMNNTRSKILEESWEFGEKQMTFLVSLSPYNIIKFLDPHTGGIWKLKKCTDRNN